MEKVKREEGHFIGGGWTEKVGNDSFYDSICIMFSFFFFFYFSFRSIFREGYFFLFCFYERCLFSLEEIVSSDRHHCSRWVVSFLLVLYIAFFLFEMKLGTFVGFKWLLFVNHSTLRAILFDESKSD